VIGTLGPHASLDSDGHRINDPFPTPFPGSGFDLDAVGVINVNTVSVHGISANAFRMYPNPAGSQIQLDLPEEWKNCNALITDVQGKMLREAILQKGTSSISLEGFAEGTYFISLKKEGVVIGTKMFVHSEH
jgi:hypothetical protein